MAKSLCRRHDAVPVGYPGPMRCAQVFRCDVLEASGLDGRVEVGHAPRVVPHHRAAVGREQHGVSVGADVLLQMPAQAVEEEDRQRDRADLVVYRGVEVLVAANLQQVRLDLEPAFSEVDVLAAQCEGLADAEPGVRDDLGVDLS